MRYFLDEREKVCAFPLSSTFNREIINSNSMLQMEDSNKTRLTPRLDRFGICSDIFFPSSLNASNSQARNKTNFYRPSSNKKELHNEMEIKPYCLKSFVKDPCQNCFFFLLRSSSPLIREGFLLLRMSQSGWGRVSRMFGCFMLFSRRYGFLFPSRRQIHPKDD